MSIRPAILYIWQFWYSTLKIQGKVMVKLKGRCHIWTISSKKFTLLSLQINWTSKIWSISNLNLKIKCHGHGQMLMRQSTSKGHHSYQVWYKVQKLVKSYKVHMVLHWGWQSKGETQSHTGVTWLFIRSLKEFLMMLNDRFLSFTTHISTHLYFLYHQLPFFSSC